MAPPPRQKFSFWSDSPFSAEQSTFIIFKYRELKSTAGVRRVFGTKFHPKNQRKVSQQVQFQRVIDNFIKTASLCPQAPAILAQNQFSETKKIVNTWNTLGIKILKPPNISFLKLVGFVHFSHFLIRSETYYNLQSCWITLYHIIQSDFGLRLAPIVFFLSDPSHFALGFQS